MVCSISSGGLGICLTAISLMRLIISFRHRDTWVDDLLSADALLFLAALIASYLSLRRVTGDRWHRLERTADATFLLAVTLLTVNCFLVTYAVSAT
jgi:hypothetical protein